MKRIIILLLALMPYIVAGAQGFIVENNAIMWQKVYQSDMTIEDIYKAMIVSNDFQGITMVDRCIVANIKPVKYIPKDYGFKWGNSNTLLLNGALGPAFIRIDVKEGRYRVTASDIMVTDITHGGLSHAGALTALEDVALERGTENEMMTEQFGPIFGQFLERMTSFEKVDDNW